MSSNKNEREIPQPQTAANPAGDPASNLFDNGRTADQNIQQAGEEVEKEQQFKEAQTERD